MEPLFEHNMFETLEDFSSLSLSTFIEILQRENDAYTSLEEAQKLLQCLKDYQESAGFTIHVLKQYSELVNEIAQSIEFYTLSKRKETLVKEGVLAKVKQQSGDLSAKTNLLKKLEQALSENTKKLGYFKEDYLKIKNQVDQIKQEIAEKKAKMKALDDSKKDAFNQINKITRQMEESTPKESVELPDAPKETSRYEQVKELRNQAKESQLEINKMKSLVKEKQDKLKQLSPNYEKLKSDYDHLSELIVNDSERIKKLRNEIGDQLEQSDAQDMEDLDIDGLNLTNTPEEIDRELQWLESRQEKILKESNLVREEDPKNVENLIKQIDSFSKKVNTLKKEFLISYTEEEIVSIIDAFRNAEKLIETLQDFQNRFLLEINLTAALGIVLNETNDDFLVQMRFERTKKDFTPFEELTTPEKIFVVITFYLSIKVLLQTKKILFSNLLLPAKYNKRGSIYRTIQKVLPTFSQQKDLAEFYLLFIISNLEMKKPIENIKIIQIEESAKENDE